MPNLHKHARRLLLAEGRLVKADLIEATTAYMRAIERSFDPDTVAAFYHPDIWRPKR